MGLIKVVGLGPGNISYMTLESYEILKSSNKVYVDSEIDPIIDELIARGIKISSFDDIYKNEKIINNDVKIAEKLLELAQKNNELVYAVSGHPLFGQKTVEILLEMLHNKQDKYKIQFYSAMSYLDVFITSMRIDPINNGLKIIDSLSIDTQKPDIKTGNIITFNYRELISEIKQKLLNYYPKETQIYVLSNYDILEKEKVQKIKLSEINQKQDKPLCIYIPPIIDELPLDSFDTLISIMERLRSENGCSWDKEQTHSSLKKHMIEEIYEAIDAIENEDYDNLVEELGDVLFHIIFHCQIGRELNNFSFKDVLVGINKKMIKRHPHVFEENDIMTSTEVEYKWEKIKQNEKGYKTHTQSMKQVPKSLPSMIRAEKIQKKAANVGFDWNEPLPAIDKLIEECNELKDSIGEMNNEEIINEAGDLIFSIINVCRLLKINTQEALDRTINKFVYRFSYIEDKINNNSKKFQDYTLDQLENLWEEAKKE